MKKKIRVGTSFLMNTSCEGKKYYRLQLSAGKEYLKDTGQIFKLILLFENF